MRRALQLAAAATIAAFAFPGGACGSVPKVGDPDAPEETGGDPDVPGDDAFETIFVIDPEPEPEPEEEPVPGPDSETSEADGDGGASDGAAGDPDPELPAEPDVCTDLTDPTCPLVFLIGTNPVEEDTPETFTPFEDEGDACIVKGTQGWWMILAAFKTRGVFEGKVLIQGSIEQDGEVLVENGFDKQTLEEGGDGFSYFFNYFLPFSCPPKAGTEGRLWFSMSDTFGHKVEYTLDVTFQCGPPTEADRQSYCAQGAE